MIEIKSGQCWCGSVGECEAVLDLDVPEGSQAAWLEFQDQTRHDETRQEGPLTSGRDGARPDSVLTSGGDAARPDGSVAVASSGSGGMAAMAG